MLTIFLAGGGPRTEPWFLFLVPLIAILVIVKAVELSVQFIKKRKLIRENQMVNELTAPYENTIEDINPNN